MNEPTKYYQGQRKEIAALLPKQYSKVLEIGCGAGTFRNNFEQEHEYWGVEPVEAIAKLAQGKLDRVLVGTYEETIDLIPNNYFDLVICNDVIEHMPDHDQFLQSIKAKITTNGSLVASIPNVRYVGNLSDLLVKKDWKYRDEGVLDRTHLRFFTRKSLLRTFRENAFSVEQITGINFYKPPSFLNRIVYCCAILIFSGDIKYLQFAVRVKDSEPVIESVRQIVEDGR